MDLNFFRIYRTLFVKHNNKIQLNNYSNYQTKYHDKYHKIHPCTTNMGLPTFFSHLFLLESIISYSYLFIQLFIFLINGSYFNNIIYDHVGQINILTFSHLNK